MCLILSMEASVASGAARKLPSSIFVVGLCSLAADDDTVDLFEDQCKVLLGASLWHFRMDDY